MSMLNIMGKWKRSEGSINDLGLVTKALRSFSFVILHGANKNFQCMNSNPNKKIRILSMQLFKSLDFIPVQM